MAGIEVAKTGVWPIFFLAVLSQTQVASFPGLNCGWAYPRFRTRKRVKVAGYMYLAIGHQISYTPSIERIVV